jgi:hypothetical protein
VANPAAPSSRRRARVLVGHRPRPRTVLRNVRTTMRASSRRLWCPR